MPKASASIQSVSPNTKQTKEPAKTTTQASRSKSTEVAPTVGKYKKIEVDGGNLSGTRQPLVVVDIGYGSREYWAYTNEYRQLIRVTAKR